VNILVCIKRVPATGGKITLTPDAQEIDTRFLGFTVSPHEECAVEEAVQITERLGGTVSVLTLGPPEAAGQLRDRKVKHVIDTGAEAIISGNPGCLLQIATGLEDAGKPLRIMHLVEVLDRSIDEGQRRN
jgi:hypothetical protein